MFKKWNQFLARKTQEWGAKKVIFIFVKLPIFLLAVYSVIMTAAFLWSLNKNLVTAKDFVTMEEACDRLIQRQRNSQRYQSQYRQVQYQQQYQQNQQQPGR